MILFLLLISFLCNAGERPGTPVVPSSHRMGFMRVWSATPPSSPASPHSPKTPRVIPTSPTRDRDLSFEASMNRTRSTHVSESDMKRVSYLSDSQSQTYLSSESELSVVSDDDVETIQLKCLPEPGWWERFIENFKKRKSQGSSK